jgi:hypothetical protein
LLLALVVAGGLDGSLLTSGVAGGLGRLLVASEVVGGFRGLRAVLGVQGVSRVALRGRR